MRFRLAKECSIPGCRIMVGRADGGTELGRRVWVKYNGWWPLGVDRLCRRHTKKYLPKMDKATKKDSKDQVGKEKKVESKPKPPPIVQKLAPVQPAKDSRTLGRRIRDKVGGFLGSVFRRKGRT